MDTDEIMLDITDKMDKSIENLEKKFATVRTGRANPSSLDGVMVEYYGSMTPLHRIMLQNSFGHNSPCRNMQY